MLSLLLLVAFGCDDKPKTESAPSTAPQGSSAAANDVIPSVPITAAEAVVGADGSVTRAYRGDHFELTVSAPSCKAKADCTATIQLVAKPGYHLNEEYPYKFAATKSAGLAYQGKEQAESFSKAAGDFSKSSATEGRMQIRYAADGSVKKLPLSGVFKMSVCNEASCQIEAPKIELDVPLSG